MLANIIIPFVRVIFIVTEKFPRTNSDVFKVKRLGMSQKPPILTTVSISLY